MKKFKRRATIGHISRNFIESILYILYIVLKLKKLGVQCFKRCANWSWNEEVMSVWRQLHQAVRKFRNCEMSCEMKSTCEISQGVSQLRNYLQAHVCHFASRKLKLHLHSCEPRCEITSKLWNHKFNL